jgi:hypothetical protein
MSDPCGDLRDSFGDAREYPIVNRNGRVINISIARNWKSVRRVSYTIRIRDDISWIIANVATDLNDWNDVASDPLPSIMMFSTHSILATFDVNGAAY